jgi:hypothetical protein
MKKIGFLLVFFAVIQFSPVHAQEDDKKISFQINPIYLLTDIIMGATEHNHYLYALSQEFQYAFHKNWNIVIRQNFMISDNYTGSNILKFFFTGLTRLMIDDYYDYENIFISLMPGIIFRPFGKGLNGMYIGLYPNIGWEKMKYNQTNNPFNVVKIDDNFLLLGFGLEAGHEWVFRNGFSMTIGGGFGRSWGIGIGDLKGQYRIPDYMYSIRLNLMMGYSY